MIFGIPLTSSFKNTIAFLTKCFATIEKNVATEGIYRVPGLRTDLVDLKLAAEVDDTIDFSTYDTHLISGLVKLYLRELPDPILVFPPKERAEYSSLALPERLLKSRQKIKLMSKEKVEILHMLCAHLNKYWIINQCSKSLSFKQNDRTESGISLFDGLVSTARASRILWLVR